jgi:hypothetical protein
MKILIGHKIAIKDITMNSNSLTDKILMTLLQTTFGVKAAILTLVKAAHI